MDRPAWRALCGGSLVGGLGAGRTDNSVSVTVRIGVVQEGKEKKKGGGGGAS